MESKEGMKSDVIVISDSEGSPSYHVAPPIDNAIPYGIPLTQAPPPAFIPVVAQASIPSTFSTEKRKRGRPRKFDGASTSTGAISPNPLSAVHPMGDRFFPWSTGVNFLTHMITVNTGEDVATKIKSLMQQEGPRAVCVMSATGMISSVTVTHSVSSTGTLTYQGLYQILSLQGTCFPAESGGSFGHLSISLVGSDGHVVSGFVAEVLTAAAPVEVMVGSFQAKKVKKRKVKSATDDTKRD